MKIRSIRVNQWRKFVAPAGITGLSDGLNVLSAPNEAGKSSLMLGLKTALFTKHGISKNAISQHLNTATGNAPVIEVVFELNGEIYTLRKRFARSPYAHLILPDGTRLQGEQAEARLSELLGHSYPKKGAGNEATMGLLGLLWVDQGAAIEAISAAEGAQRTVMDALEEVVGNVLGGEQGRRLPNMIKEELGKLVTAKTGVPTGEYKDIQKRKADLETEVAALQADFDRFAEELNEYAAVSAELTTKLEDDQAAQLDQEIAEANERLEELLGIESQIEGAESELDRRRDRQSSANKDKQDHEATKLAIDNAIREAKGLEASIAQANEEEDRLRELLAEAQRQEHTAASENDVAAEALKKAIDVLRAADAQHTLNELEARLKKADNVSATIAELSASIDANPATNEAIEQIRELNNDRSAARAAMSAAATLVEFDLEQGGASRVSLSSGELPPSGSPLEVIAPTRIAIEGVGSIQIKPQLQDAEALQRHVEEADTAVAAALRSLGAENMAAALELGRQRTAAEQNLREARINLQHLAPAEAGSLEGLREACQAEKAKLKALESAGLDTAKTPALEEARQQHAEASRLAEGAVAALDIARAGVQQARESLDQHTETWRADREKLTEKQTTLRNLRESLANGPSIDALEEAVQQADAAVIEQQAVVDGLIAKRGADTAEQMRTRVARLTTAKLGAADTIVDLRTRKAALESTLKRDGAAGVGARLAEKQRELEFAAAEYDRLAKDVGVLTLLNDVLTEAEQAARDRFMGPITEKITPYLRILFPDAEVELDESLGISAVRRNGEPESLFARLSVGTQEQINILARIAIAELMVEQGKPAMVIIDDGLAYADDSRIDRMFDILNMAAERVQIVLLSCHNSAFSRAGGKVLTIAEFEESEEMQSA